MLKTSASFNGTLILLEIILISAPFSIILCYDMLSGLYEASRGLVRLVTSRVYPWVLTNLVIRAQGLEWFYDVSSPSSRDLFISVKHTTFMKERLLDV